MIRKNNKSGIVYVLTNPAMPDLVKIGKTTRDDVQKRLNELYATGVPVPFKCEYACRVTDVHKCEEALHEAFYRYRLSKQREFFTIEPKQAIAILRYLGSEDVTVRVKKEADSIDKETQKRFSDLKKKRSLSFAQMGIPSGSLLKLCGSDKVAVKVIDAEKKDVLLSGAGMSFVNATRKVLGLDANRSVRPNDHWEYKGRLLTDIFNDFYDSSNADDGDVLAEKEVISTGVTMRADVGSSKKKRSLSFAQMGISSGSKLKLCENHDVEVEVIDARRKYVLLNGERMHFIDATRRALGLEAGASVRSNDHWEYKGRLLTDIFNDFYGSSDADDGDVRVEKETVSIGARAQGNVGAFQKKRSLSFAQMGISSGSRLNLCENHDVEVEVIDARRKYVLLNGERMHFSNATKKALGLDVNQSIRPNNHWQYKGRLLTDIFNDYYAK